MYDMSDFVSLTPSEPPAESDLQLQVVNLVGDVQEALDGVVEQALSNWSEQTGMDSNVFMRDTLRQTIFSMAIGFMTNVRANQLSSEHVEDYFRVRSTPSKPAPDPVK